MEITLLQIALVWCAGAGMALVGAMVKGGGKLVVSYLLFSVLLGPLAVLMLIFDGRKACPFCSQVLRSNIKVCIHCGHRQVYAEK